MDAIHGSKRQDNSDSTPTVAIAYVLNLNISAILFLVENHDEDYR